MSRATGLVLAGLLVAALAGRADTESSSSSSPFPARWGLNTHLHNPDLLVFVAWNHVR